MYSKRLIGSLVITWLLVLLSGCSQDDSPSAIENGGLTSGSGTSGTINFISADPENIVLRGGAGAGLVESATLTFELNDSSDQPIEGQTVYFELTGSAGGVQLDKESDTTDESGIVTVVVTSGSIPGVVSVRATAILGGEEVFAQSNAPFISAGLPDSDSISLSLDTFNPEGFNIDGTEVQVSVQLADVYNNPPPPNTPVFFTTEGGVIGDKCVTDDLGRCSVTWISGNPRPIDGRATVVAYTIGVESFNDQDGDGYYDTGEAHDELPEAYNDENENGIYDSGEFFVDFNENGSFDAPDGSYNGYLCDDAATDCSAAQPTINIFDQAVIVMSGSYALIRAEDGANNLLADESSDFQNVIDLTSGGQTVTVTFSDQNFQPLPRGTTISVETTAGDLTGETDYTVKNSTSSGENSFVFSLEDSDTETNKTGLVTITVATPNDFETIIKFNVME